MTQALNIATVDLSYPECITPSATAGTPIELFILKTFKDFSNEPCRVKLTDQSSLRILEKDANSQKSVSKFVPPTWLRPLGVIRPSAAVVAEAKARRKNPEIELSRRGWEEQARHPCPLRVLASIEGAWSLYRPISMVCQAQTCNRRCLVTGPGAHSVALRTGAWFGSRITPAFMTDIVSYAPHRLSTDAMPWKGGGADFRWKSNISLWIAGYQLRSIMVDDVHLGTKASGDYTAEKLFAAAKFFHAGIMAFKLLQIHAATTCWSFYQPTPSKEVTKPPTMLMLLPKTISVDEAPHRGFCLKDKYWSRSFPKSTRRPGIDLFTKSPNHFCLPAYVLDLADNKRTLIHFSVPGCVLLVDNKRTLTHFLHNQCVSLHPRSQTKSLGSLHRTVSHAYECDEFEPISICKWSLFLTPNATIEM